MKRKILSIFLTLVLVCSFSMVTAVPATAYNYDDYTGAITKTADRLVALQSVEDGLLVPPDFGWDFIVTGLDAHSIEPSADNLYGVTALGLIDAYEVTEVQSYLDAAGLVADMMIDYGTGYEAFKDAGLGHSFDLRFLMRYAEASNDTSYSDFAKAYWDWVKARDVEPNVYADGSQEAFYQCYTPLSHGYAAWGTGDFGLAALAMGDTAWASDMAVIVSNHLSEISVEAERFIGWGKALELLNAVDSVAYSTEIGNLINNLTDSQDGSGYWGLDPLGNTEGNAQDTAYAIMGLAVAGGADAIAAAEKGADWLVESQNETGGWIWEQVIEDEPAAPREISETDSEALQAIKAVLDISSSVSLTAVSEAAVIGISVSPTSIGFGAVTSGATVAGPALTVTNTGNVGITVDADIAADTLFNDTEYFYTAALRLNGMPSDKARASPDLTKLGSWAHSDFWDLAPIEVKGTRPVTAGLQCPPEIKADTTYTGTVVFWAMQPEETP